MAEVKEDVKEDVKEVFKFRVYPYYHGNNDVSCDGSPYEDDWQLDENGVPYVAGQYNVDDTIQQYEKECDINNIIASHVALGTLNELAVQAVDDHVIDVSNVPNDLNSLNTARNRLLKTYEMLNPEQKKLFDDFDDFVLNFSRLYKSNNNSNNVPEESEVNVNE